MDAFTRNDYQMGQAENRNFACLTIMHFWSEKLNSDMVFWWQQCISFDILKSDFEKTHFDERYDTKRTILDLYHFSGQNGLKQINPFFSHMVDTSGTTLCGGTRKKHSHTRDMIQKTQRLDVLKKTSKLSNFFLVFGFNTRY